jgi:lipoprotein-anchoring transpeptidase ErfK/SrfK
MTDTTATTRRLRGRTWALLVLSALLAAALATVTITSLAWGASLREDGRLLPGTLISSVPVGEATLDEAIAAVQAHLEPQLDQVVEVAFEDQVWPVTARELGATTDVEDVVAVAFDRTVGASLPTLAWMRWAGGTTDVALDAHVVVPDERLTAFVTSIAQELDRDPRDATLSWTDDGFTLAEALDGRTVDQGAARDALAAAFELGETSVALPVDLTAPAVGTDLAQQAADDLTPRIDAALDRTVTATLDSRSWTTSPRELGATPDVEPLVAAAFAGETASGEVALDIPDDALAEFVATIASAVNEPARDAQFSWSGGKANITPERNGRALARDAATADLRDALRSGQDTVQVSMVTVRPSVTAATFNRYLVVDQRARVLHLVEGNNIIRTWPVAVGLAGSPTPTGIFQVGTKRYEPTWVNPSPNGWGKDMPARIGPGPDNPLGLRALNWNNNGRDTLIRFHGTPNEASIGEEASRGCVRMYNKDVIELYDLVSTGTTIVSVR